MLEYDGAAFEGWQTQAPGVRTVQAVVEAALAELAGGPVALVGASRTDAGVHAEGQVASVRFDTRLTPAVLLRALDAKLPADVAVRELAAAPEAFHARRDARWKRYRYSWWSGRVRSPLRRGRFARVRGPLDVAAMAAAATALVGTHDFSCFQLAAAEWHAEAARRGHTRSATRTLYAATVRGEEAGEGILELVGDGFLRGMVRAIAGTLVQVGRGRRTPESLGELLAGRDRRRAGPTAPAAGLTLVEVGFAPFAPVGPLPVGETSGNSGP